MERDELEKKYGEVWNTTEVQEKFEIIGFQAPFCVAKRRSDGVKGLITFQHRPRYYFDFEKSDL